MKVEKEIIASARRMIGESTHTHSLSVNGEAKGGGSGMAVWMLLKCV